VFHAYGKEGEDIHAMGHSKHPEGFAEMKQALDDFFGKIYQEYQA